MGAPIGNKNALGNEGGGRKSAYQERADAELLHQMFFGEMSGEEIKEKLKSGKFSLKDVFLSKAFAGNEKMLIAIFKKLFPDSMNIGNSTEPLRNLTDEQLDDYIAQLKNFAGESLEGEDNSEVD